MGFNWKTAVRIAAKAAKDFTPEKADTALDVVTAILESEETPDAEGMKVLAKSLDALAKEAKSQRAELDSQSARIAALEKALKVKAGAKKKAKK